MSKNRALLSNMSAPWGLWIIYFLCASVTETPKSCLGNPCTSLKSALHLEKSFQIVGNWTGWLRSECDVGIKKTKRSPLRSGNLRELEKSRGWVGPVRPCNPYTTMIPTPRSILGEPNFVLTLEMYYKHCDLLIWQKQLPSNPCKRMTLGKSKWWI